jgi:drug/metabolite transporter (DMT)-like permease
VRLAGFGLVAAALVVLVLRRRKGSVRARAEAVLGLDKLRASGRSAAAVVPVFIVMGVGDTGGNGFFVLALHAGASSVAVVLSSLYPVATALLAAVLLRERLRPVQLAGVALAVLSVPLLR